MAIVQFARFKADQPEEMIKTAKRTKVRYSGVSLGYNLASIFAGALSPLIATGLMTAYKPQTWPISVYMIGLALITIVSVYFATETRKRPESGEADHLGVAARRERTRPA